MPGPLNVSAKVEWFDTEFDVIKDEVYLVTASSSSDYKDAGLVPCTPDGPRRPFRWFLSPWRDLSNPANPLSRTRRDKVKRLRVLKDGAHFLTLIGCIGKIDGISPAALAELEKSSYVLGSKSRFTAVKSGRLYLFANDWPADPQLGPDDPYGNNRGTLQVTITRQ